MINKIYIKLGTVDGANNKRIEQVKLWPDSMEHDNLDDFICIDENSSRQLPSIFKKSWDSSNIIDYVETLDEYKTQKINELSRQSFQHELNHVPEYKKINAIIGIYSEVENKKILDFGSVHCRQAFYNAKSLVDNAITKEEIDLIEAVWPVWSNAE